MFSRGSSEIRRNFRWKSLLLRILILFGFLFVHVMTFGFVDLLLVYYRYISERQIHFR